MSKKTKELTAAEIDAGLRALQPGKKFHLNVVYDRNRANLIARTLEQSGAVPFTIRTKADKVKGGFYAEFTAIKIG